MAKQKKVVTREQLENYIVELEHYIATLKEYVIGFIGTTPPSPHPKNPPGIPR